MPATASTPTSMRWWSSSALLPLLAAACMTSSQNYYVPSDGEPRLNTHALRDQADRILTVECPRLMSDGSPSGEAEIVVDVAPGGQVSRARVAKSAGDEQVDQYFGALAARLEFDPGTVGGEATTTRVYMGYSCSPGIATSTVRVAQQRS